MNNRLFQWQLLPIWLGFAFIMMPFLSIWRVGVLSSFYLEAGSLLMALLFVVMSACVFWANPVANNAWSWRARLPSASVYFVVLALFWAIQARVMDLTYVGLSDMVAWTFVVYALLAWACRGWMLRYGQERVVSILASVLMVTACLQGVVAWLQYSDYASYFSGYLMYRKGIVEGQLGQYNHLGHFMMWGILATAYLWGVRRVATWIAIPILLYLTATTGIITSRALIAYVLAMMLLLPIWRILAGKSANRVVATLAVATLAVVVFQFALEPILQLFSNGTQLSSGLERLGSHSHEGSGRSFEWKKAWLVFQSSMLWGHGWGSYPIQSFLLDSSVYPSGFRLYDANVLFTHSHNSFLNLLAEMGLVGTVLVLGGLAWVIRGCLKVRNAPSVLLLALMAVSLTHSFLEYPLWYIYFLTAFVLFPMLMPSADGATEIEQASQSSDAPIRSSHPMVPMAVGIFAVMIMVGILRLAFVYVDLLDATRKTSSSREKAKQVMALTYISRAEPMLAYYADLSLVNHIDTHAKEVPDWAIQSAKRSSLYRPYAHTHKWALLAHRTGETEHAKMLFQKIYHYYPTQLHVYGSAIMSSPYYEDLQADYTATCEAYLKIRPNAEPCAESAEQKLKIINKTGKSNVKTTSQVQKSAKAIP